MTYLIETAFFRPTAAALLRLVLVVAGIQAFSTFIIAHPEITTSEDQTTVIVNDAPEQEVFAIGKSVLVKRNAKGVLAVGGDVTVEGRIEGDIATIGGDVIQKEGAYVGGDIIVIGGAYKTEGPKPLRELGKQTVTLGVFEEELRNIGQNPSQIFSPSLSVSFVAQRLLVALLWFVLTFAITTLAPGAISRAVTRIKLSWLKICALGAVTFVFLSSSIVFGALAMPSYLSVPLVAMGTLFLVLGYVFGRVALQVAVGKVIQRQFLSETNRSETLAVLIGVLAWTVLLSLPYLWLIALFAVFSFGIGLVVTGRTPKTWQNP